MELRTKILGLVALLVGCVDSPDMVEPVVPTKTPTVIPTPIPAIILTGHFTSEYAPGLKGISVKLYQGNNIYETTTDTTGGFKFVTGLSIGQASIVGVAKSGCCWTSLPITLHAGTNDISIPVIFI